MPGTPEPGPTLPIRERDRRWNGLRAIMRAHDIQAIIVGSFQGRERLEHYLSNDFLDATIVLTLDHPATMLSFSGSRVSRVHESARRGHQPWITDIRIASGGAAAGNLLIERTLATARIGLVGLGPTAPGEAEGLMPLGFHTALRATIPHAEFVDFTTHFTDFILLKSDDELALLRFAARVSEEACAVMRETAHPGVSEAAVYAEIMREIHRWGCDVRYPFLSLQSGPDNIAWGEPAWLLRAEPPRILQPGDLVQAEIHTCYGGQESQVQMSVALAPIDPAIQRAATAARAAYEAGLAAIRPGATFADIVHAMESPLRDGGYWSKTPLLHTLTFGSTGFTPQNREQIAGTPEGEIERHLPAGIRRGDLVLQPGMTLQIEPNACLGTKRVNLGGAVLVTETGSEELNNLPTRMQAATNP